MYIVVNMEKTLKKFNKNRQMIEERNISFSEHQEEFEKYENSITIYEITDKETAKRLGGNIGDEYTTKRIPQTKEEALERLRKYDAMRIFFALVENFNDKYSLNIKTLRDELDTINEFIENAEKIKMDEATNVFNKKFNPSKNYENEYIKLKYGHYENKNYSNYLTFFESTTSFIQAKYFLYKDLLENEIKNIENESKAEQEINNSETSISNKTKMEERIWFKVGILFAKGTPQKLYSKYKNEKSHFKKITLELGFKETDRPYFSQTINNSTKLTSNDDKNIYKKYDKMEQIYNYCTSNKINICPQFITQFNQIKPD